MEYTIPACSGKRIEVKQGQTIVVIDIDGGQVVDFFAEIKLQFYVMDLTAVNDANDEAKSNGLVDWAKAFSAGDWETVEKIDNAGVKEAARTMETIMSSPEQRQRILNRRKALLDYKSQIEDAEAKGKTEGAFEMLANLVKNGLLSLQDAAKQVNMTEKAFAEKAGFTIKQ